MILKSNWRKSAVCATDKNPERWLSYDIKDLEYARDGCARCPVKRECLVTALEEESTMPFVGMVAGISEYEYLLSMWKEVNNENESNWRTGDSALSKLLRKTK